MPDGPGHGFAYVDPAEEEASAGAGGYYSWVPKPGFRFISLDSVSGAGIIGPDESAPPCTSTDSHAHDVNPGCDLDPRNSAPIHLGADMEALALEFPHVIAWVAGHSHVNSIEPHPAPSGTGGFWSIRVAAEADWPQQTRLLEVFDNDDGTPLDRRHNDTPSGGRACGDSPCGEGEADDRNVELLLGDPRRSPAGNGGGGGGGKCTNLIKGTKKRDRLRGTAGGDRLRGRRGADRINGKKGRDCIQGGRGNDRLTGGKDRDQIKGGGGRDRIKAGDGARDEIRCGAGRDRVKADRKDRVNKSCERVKRSRR